VNFPFALERRCKLPVLALLIFLAQAPQALASRSMCTATEYLVYPGATIELGVATPSGQPPPSTIRWHPDAGSITLVDNRWSWRLAGVAPGFYSAAAEISADDQCSISVIVRLPPITSRGDQARQTAKRLLVPGENEVSGYGLYSYLLLARHVNGKNKERYLASILSILDFPDADELEHYVTRYRKISSKEARKRINITYLPVRRAPPDDVLELWEEQSLPEVAEWVLANYDYSRARAILDILGRDGANGPYIVSFIEPTGSFDGRHLFQDQSNVPADLVSLWTQQFQFQAAQEEYWDEPVAKNLMLRMRTWIAVAGQGLPLIRKALVDWKT